MELKRKEADNKQKKNGCNGGPFFTVGTFDCLLYTRLYLFTSIPTCSNLFIGCCHFLLLFMSPLSSVKHLSGFTQKNPTNIEKQGCRGFDLILISMYRHSGAANPDINLLHCCEDIFTWRLDLLWPHKAIDTAFPAILDGNRALL